MDKNFIRTILNEYSFDEILEILNVEKYEALQALAEIGIVDIERFEQYFNEQEDD